MDVEKLFKLATDKLSDYFWVFINTLKKPDLYLKPILVNSHHNSILQVSTRQPEVHKRINPEVFVFVFISIFIGFAILSLVPNLVPPEVLIFNSLYLLIFWFLTGVFTHIVAKLIRREGDLEDAISIVLQLFAVIYVFSAFAGFMGGMILKFAPSLNTFIDKINPFKSVANAFFFFYVVKAILTTIYFPISIGKIYKVGLRQQRYIALVFTTLFILITLAIALSVPVVSYMACDATLGAGCGGG